MLTKAALVTGVYETLQDIIWSTGLLDMLMVCV